MHEITKYHNSLNEVSFKKFTSKEFDLFFALCYKLKEKNTETVRLTFEELKEIINYKFTGKERFIKDLDNVYRKMLELNFKFEDDDVLERFTLFKSYSIHKNENFIDVAVNERFEFVLNALDGNFTRFELEEFVDLKSSYSKTMYRLLKQWRTVGKKSYKIEEFRKLLDIPESYRMDKVTTKVLNPIERELTQYFKNLKICKIKKGRTIIALEFTFTAEKRVDNKKELPTVSIKNWLDD